MTIPGSGPQRPQPAPTGTTAVVVTAGTTPYLADTLTALARQGTTPDLVLLVDVASRDNGLGDGTPVGEVAATTGLADRVPVRVVHRPGATGFRDAVAQGLAVCPSGPLTPGAPRQRLWLLHDDSAPEPGCLDALLHAAGTTSSSALLGTKQLDWDNPGQLLEAGLSTTASARRATGVTEGEVDQGQHDDRSDVLAVGTAGALIDRDTWDEAAGPAPLFPVFGDGLELSRAVRLAGHRVVVVPGAAVRHRQASYLGLRQHEAGTTGADSRPAPCPGSSFRARRAAQLAAWASFSPAPAPLLLAWFLLLGAARALCRAGAKEPALAVDELTAALTALRHAPLIHRERRRLARLSTVSRAVVAELYTSPREIRAQQRDRARQLRERAARAAAPSELELRELAALRRTRRAVLGLLLTALAAASLAGLSSVLATRAVTGGALASFEGTWHDAWGTAWSTWGWSEDGLPALLSPATALLSGALLLAAPLGLDAGALAHLLLLLAVPAAGAGAWAASGALTRRPALRAGAALTWAGAPALLLAVGHGRVPAVLVHLLLPWALLALARATGTDRRDVILSGMVGAHHLPASGPQEDATPEDATTLEGATTPEDGTAAPAPDEGAPGTADEAEGPVDDDPATPVTDDPRGLVVTADTRRGALARAAATVQHGPGSATAAAVAGLLLGAVTALDASVGLLAALLLALLLTQRLLTGRPWARLLLTLAPVLTTGAQPWWRAAASLLAAAHGGAPWPTALADAARGLLAQAGTPLPVAPPSAGDLLLGLPLDPSALGAPATALTALRCALAVLPLLALTGAVLGGTPGARARAGLLGAVAGLALALAALRVLTGTGPDVLGASGATGALATAAGWAGTGLSVLQAGLTTSALASLDQAHAHLLRHRPGWRHALTHLAGAAALAAPAAVLAAWALAAHTLPATVMLRPAGQSVPVIAQEMEEATGSRVLVLGTQDGALTVALWRGGGTVLTDVLPAVTTTRMRAWTSGDATHATPASGPQAPAAGALRTATTTGTTTWTQALDTASTDLADLAVRATTGGDEEAAAGLARHGVAVVLLTDLSSDSAAARALAGLESTPGLEQLAQTPAGRAWRVSAGTGQTVSPAQLTSGGTTTYLPWTTTTLEATLPADNGPRTLLLAERADDAWTATLDGQPLATATDPAGWRQAFTVPTGGGRLVVTRSTARTDLLAATTWAVWGATSLAALPVRRRRTTP